MIRRIEPKYVDDLPCPRSRKSAGLSSVPFLDSGDGLGKESAVEASCLSSAL